MSEQPRLLGGRYEVGELIGRGGMAEVHLGHDTRLGRSVAIKMLRSDLARDPTFLMRFRREAQAAAGLNHPNVVATFDSGEDVVFESGGAEMAVPYIVMEYVAGQTLRAMLTAQGHIEPAEASRITEALLEALAYSHRRGIVHRDIKPANVMIAKDGTVKVMDFGIARAIADSTATMTSTQTVIGTAQYLSPEQAQGRSVDHRSDLYSTGCLLFELLTGRPPFSGDSPVAIAYQHVSEPPPRPSTMADGVSRDVDAVVLHSLAKDRDARYQQADDFRRDLTAARLGRPISGAARGALAASAGMPGAHVPGAPAGAAGVAPTQVAGGSGPTAYDSPTRRPEEERDTNSFDAIGEPERERRPGLMILLALTTLAALLLLGLAGKNLLDQRAAERARVAVPSLIALTQAEAETALKDRGLQAKVVRTTSSAQEGRVFDQDPPAGSQVSKSSVVTLSVSNGPAEVSVPDVGGFEQDAARTALEQVDLAVGSVQEVDGSDQPAGRVISTSPGAGQKVARGTKLVLRVSSGKVAVPRVIGLDSAKARSALFELGFRTKTSERQSTRPEGTVLDQSPGEGTVQPRGAMIEIVVASPPAKTQTTVVTETRPPSATTSTTTTSTTSPPTTSNSPTSTSPTPSSTTTTSSPPKPTTTSGTPPPP